MVVLENEVLKAEISLHGAELRSVVRKDKDMPYLWYGDAAYWGRCSPVLFPFVGSVKDKTYRFEGVSYPMGQHGFARDMDFVPVSQNADSAWFALEQTEETLKVYPFAFRLEIGYELDGGSIRVLWRVKNTGNKTMYFSIGAHPAFLCPPKQGEEQAACRIVFYDRDGVSPDHIVSSVIGAGGLVTGEKVTIRLKHGALPIAKDLFDHDALVLENSQVQQIGLVGAIGKEYLRVEFDAPLVGVWSPAGKQAPFVCIEPWYGRCDAADFSGELPEREWGNTLKQGAVFAASYTIITG